MKKLIMSLALVSTSAMAATPTSMIFNEIILKKTNSKELGLQLIVNRDTQTWCSGFGSQLSIGTFEVGEKIDALAEGLYKCDGKFVKVRTELSSPAQAFEIGTCSEINAVELKADCPPKK